MRVPPLNGPVRRGRSGSPDQAKAAVGRSALDSDCQFRSWGFADVVMPLRTGVILLCPVPERFEEKQRFVWGEIRPDFVDRQTRLPFDRGTTR